LRAIKAGEEIVYDYVKGITDSKMRKERLKGWGIS